MYMLDIVKDSAQLLLMLAVVGGHEHVFKYWLSFSSVVSHIWQNKQISTYCVSSYKTPGFSTAVVIRNY